MLDGSEWLFEWSWQPSTLSLGSGEYQQEFHTTDGIVEFEELFSHGNCLSLMLTAADFDMSADVQVYHPEKVSSEEKMRVFLDHGEGLVHVKLIEDITLSETVNVSNGKNFEIDLNGHVVNRNIDEIVENGHVFSVNAGATLTILDNSVAQSGTVTGGKATQGGAVYNADTFIIESGRLSGNQGDQGGAIFNDTGARCVIRDQGIIRSNGAEDHGGGVWSQGVLEMQGNIQVKDNQGDNVYLANGCTIAVTGPITSGENSIGIEMENRGKVTTGYGTSGTEVNPFFACGSLVNKVVATNGECWWCYGYIECSWDNELNKLVQTERTIPIDKVVKNICSPAFANGGELVGDSNWFIAEGCSSTAQGFTCNGDVHLILCDEAIIDIDNGLYLNLGSTLHIYCQSYGEKMGKLFGV